MGWNQIIEASQLALAQTFGFFFLLSVFSEAPPVLYEAAIAVWDIGGDDDDVVTISMVATKTTNCEFVFYIIILLLEPIPWMRSLAHMSIDHWPHNNGEMWIILFLHRLCKKQATDIAWARKRFGSWKKDVFLLLPTRFA